MKPLIAITGPHSIRTRDVVKTLLTALKLLHINIRQPIVDFTADCVNVDPYHLDHHVPLHQYFSECGVTLREMQKTIHHYLCLANKNYLTDFAKKEMDKNNFLFLHGACGFIVSNITTETEAAWVRKNNGLLIHVSEHGFLANELSLKKQPGDEEIITCRESPPDVQNLAGVINRISQHLQQSINAKAA
ncbi:MAG: hypothetical protein V4493_05710 [Pseudomonadota bacterium]